MKLKEILAISGQPGLYRYLAQSNNGIIVESLLDGKRSNASATARVSALAEIAIFTETDDIPLAQIFETLYKISGGREAINPKATPEMLKAKFGEVLPDYDRDRVHVSDMKKIFSWYNILVNAGMTEFKVEDEEEATQETAAEPEAKTAPEKKAPAKKAAAPKKTEPKETAPKTAAKKAPAKKAAAKKDA